MLSLNWIDYLILAVLAIHAFEGYSGGFLRSFLDLINLIISFLLGLKFYGLIAGILVSEFSLSAGFSNAIGFFMITFIAEILIALFIGNFLGFNHPPVLKTIPRIFGILPGILSGTILVCFVLILIVAMPLSGPVRRAISSSRVGNFLLFNAQGWEGSIDSVFGGAINETINFLTVEPKGNKIVSLNFKTNNVSLDPNSEWDMFKLVNKERSKRGVKELIFDSKLQDVGRGHCRDMFGRGYFSHYTPEGLSPFDRIAKAGISFEAAGENLALSPNTDIAMQGLMNSPGHKANILSADFGKIGIGVIDGGIYGEMFCQEFMN